tara:strand:- start:362 stop:538 length:177 start_codon:yes stop_codon:yes gene_type:complete
MSEELEKDMQDMQTNSIEQDVKYRQGRSRWRVEQTERATGMILCICAICIAIMWYTSL